MPDPAVVVDQVTITYRVRGKAAKRAMLADPSGARPKHVTAVDDVSFVAAQGETIGVIGRNGSGKSSLLRAVAGLQPVASGSILAADMPVLLGVGAALKGNLTGRENILLAGTALGVSRARMRSLIDDVVEFSGLGDSIDFPFKSYSSGMKSRLQFSVSTSVQPSILLVDEALAVGDEEFKERSNQRIQELVGGASTVFLVSHSLSTVRTRCDRVLWLEKGRKVMWNDAGAVIDAYREDMVQRRARRAEALEAKAKLEHGGLEADDD